MKACKHTPFLWIPSMYVAEEILSAMVFYVFILMFFQTSPNQFFDLTLFGVMLTLLPWTIKGWLYKKMKSSDRVFCYQMICQIVLLVLMLIMSFTLCDVLKFFFLKVFFFPCISILTAFHQTLSAIIYERALSTREQALYRRTKNISINITDVITYGVIIIVVGLMQISLRKMDLAWSIMLAVVTCVYAAAFIIYGFCRPRKSDLNESSPISENQMGVGFCWRHYLLLGIMLLPQALLFYSRVLFLLEHTSNGGLGCSLQELGFAQGTVGVAAMVCGAALGRRLLHTCKDRQQCQNFLSLCLSLSPAFYMLMALHPLVGNLTMICVMTFFAQLCLGIGVYACSPIIDTLFGDNYRNATNQLYIPAIIICMILPIAFSGLMVDLLGFKHFFIVDALTGMLAFVAYQIYSLNR